MPQISVIVPVYKVEKYLRECVDSILAQTYRDFELILVDDGSPDSCGAICDEYAAKDSRIRVIHQENQGVSAARNAALDVAKGEFIAFVDGDDYLHPEMLSLTFRLIREHGADVCAFGVCQFPDGNKPPLDQLLSESLRILSNREACMEVCRNQNWMPIVCNKLYKSTVFRNIRFPIGRYHEDEAVSHVLMYSAKKTVQIPGKLYFYRENQGSIMHNPELRKFYDKAVAYSERYQFLVDKGEQEMARIAMRTRNIQFAKYTIAARLENQPVDPQFAVSIRKAFQIIQRECSEQNYEWWLSQFSRTGFRLYLLKKKIKALVCGRR